MTVHPLVDGVVRAYLDAIDAEVPGLVEALYLGGSVALGDFHPDASDVDFIAVTCVRPFDTEITALSRAHSRLVSRQEWPAFEGIYVTWQDLARNPSRIEPGPHAHGGRVYATGSRGRNPVTWHTLATRGIAVRGPHRDEAEIWTDRAELSAWTRENLNTYWRDWLARSSRLASPLGLAGFGTWAPAWGVLGVSRMRYTLDTGLIASKTNAGGYARRRFDERWRRILNECLRIRRGGEHPLYRNAIARRRDALAFMTMVIDGVG